MNYINNISPVKVTTPMSTVKNAQVLDGSELQDPFKKVGLK